MISSQKLKTSKALLVDALVRGTASRIKDCIYVYDRDVIEEINEDDKRVVSFDLAVDREQLLRHGWWLGEVDRPISSSSIEDLIIAKFTIIAAPSVSDYKRTGIHTDDKLSDSALTEHAIFLSRVETLVPILGKFIAKKAAHFIAEQAAATGHYKFVVCATSNLLFYSVSDVKNEMGFPSINMGIQFPWKVDYEKTNRYTGLCFYKI